MSPFLIVFMICFDTLKTIVFFISSMTEMTLGLNLNLYLITLYLHILI